MGLVTLDPIWCEVIVLVNIFDTFDQLFGEPLLRDGFALVLSAIGNKELGFAVAPDVAGAVQVLVQSSSDTESVHHRIFLVVHCWHGRDVLTLVKTLARNHNLVKSVTPALENLM